MTQPVRAHMVEDDFDPQTVAGVLRESIDALTEAGIEPLVIGGIATSTYGRPSSVRDIDLLIREHEAAAALEVLARAGFETNVEYPDWLYKAFKNDVLIDIIFKGAGDIIADDEMFAHSREMRIMQTRMQLVAPEDLIVMLVSASRDGTDYWHNAEGVVEKTDLDWAYLLKRARPHGLRVLSLLLYCVSSGIEVPLPVIRELYERSIRALEVPPG